MHQNQNLAGNTTAINSKCSVWLVSGQRTRTHKNPKCIPVCSSAFLPSLHTHYSTSRHNGGPSSPLQRERPSPSTPGAWTCTGNTPAHHCCCHDPSALTACFLTRVEWRRRAVWSALGQVPSEGAGGVCPFTPSLRPSLPGLAVDCSVHHTGGHRCSPRVGGRGSKFVPHLMLILTSSVKQSARTLTPGPAVPVRALCV